MFTFKSTTTIKSRIESVVRSHVEIRGEAWLLQMGYETCNDYAAQVTELVKFASNNEHIRFETVARCIRAYKVRIKAAQQPK